MPSEPIPANAIQKASVLVVDAHPVCREGLTMLINETPDLQVTGSAEEIGAALDLALARRPDLIVADLFMPGHTNIEVLKRLVTALPRVPVLVLSTQDEHVFGERYIKAGARGYAMKLQDPAAILSAIRQVLHGRIYVSPELRERIVTHVSAGHNGIDWRERLSDREMEVFQLMGQGFDSTGIARQLHVSPKTVAVHKTNLKRKLHVANSAELIRIAVSWDAQLLDGGTRDTAKP
jgi:DNA-binding NarL/FixJ family response regulator